VYCRLFGTFQVGGIRIEPPIGTQAQPRETESESSIDFVYGSDASQFAGVHRFGIRRLADEGGSSNSKIRVSLACLTCNPTQNKPLAPEILFTFHQIYAMLLFRESVAELLQFLHRGSG
jgi:hypothetical protein